MWRTGSSWHGLELLGQVHRGHGSQNARQIGLRAISRATRDLSGKVFNLRWWRRSCGRPVGLLAATLRSGIMGWLFGVVLLVGVPIVLAAALWWLVSRLRRLWRRFAGTGGQRQAEARSSIEFYHRFEQIVARRAISARRADPREFARMLELGWPRSAGGTSFTLGPASGRDVLQCPFRPAGVRPGRPAERRAGIGGIDGWGRKTAANVTDCNSSHSDGMMVAVGFNPRTEAIHYPLVA